MGSNKKTLTTDSALLLDNQLCFALYSTSLAMTKLYKPLLDALKKGKELRVEAASVKDARTAYHFSLKGSRDAIDKAKALCK